jgi:hypothetical protein
MPGQCAAHSGAVRSVRSNIDKKSHKARQDAQVNEKVAGAVFRCSRCAPNGQLHAASNHIITAIQVYQVLQVGGDHAIKQAKAVTLARFKTTSTGSFEDHERT